jgi:hypothetical protein
MDAAAFEEYAKPTADDREGRAAYQIRLTVRAI